MALYLLDVVNFKNAALQYKFRFQGNRTALGPNLIEDLILEGCVNAYREGEELDNIVHVFLECPAMHQLFTGQLCIKRDSCSGKSSPYRKLER